MITMEEQTNKNANRDISTPLPTLISFSIISHNMLHYKQQKSFQLFIIVLTISRTPPDSIIPESWREIKKDCRCSHQLGPFRGPTGEEVEDVVGQALIYMGAEAILRLLEEHPDFTTPEPKLSGLTMIRASAHRFQ